MLAGSRTVRVFFSIPQNLYGQGSFRYKTCYEKRLVILLTSPPLPLATPEDPSLAFMLSAPIPAFLLAIVGTAEGDGEITGTFVLDELKRGDPSPLLVLSAAVPPLPLPTLGTGEADGTIAGTVVLGELTRGDPSPLLVLSAVIPPLPLPTVGTGGAGGTSRDTGVL